MLTMREVPEGFGQKVRDWNDHENVEQWRERWADHVNARLAELDIDARIDHRSLAAQGIDLEPQQDRWSAQRMEENGQLADRAEITARSRENGERIIANPGIALDAITHQQATFTTATWRCSCIGTATEGPVQRAMSAVRGSPDLIALGKDGRGEDRFTARHDRDRTAVEPRRS
jgi:ATP-dependent exoDNAse (exonuclease V) alpha subunit